MLVTLRVYRVNSSHLNISLYILHTVLFTSSQVMTGRIIVLFILSVSVSTGDVILLGKTNMLRFNHPQEAAKLRKKRYVSSFVV